MKKYIVIIGLAICVAIVNMMNVLISNELDDSSDLFLSSMEAIADGEGESGSEVKNERMWQEGPYLDSSGDFFYWIYEETRCYGVGTVDCTESYSFYIENV